MKTLFAILVLSCGIASAQPKLTAVDAGPSTPGRIELRGLSAGAFDPRLWTDGKLHLVRDVRHPLIEPRPGKFRNIYAPSVVQTPQGWAVFYGAWDGTDTGNDRIYRADVDPDFLAVKNQRTVIEHNVFTHVCNVNATVADGTWALMCTAYPDAQGLNKPAVFFSKDGENFNGSKRPHRATHDDIITLAGYDKFRESDMNGMSVLLRDAGKWRMYFNDFRNFGKTFRATSDDGKAFQLDGVALEKSVVVNDVKKLKVGDESWYLVGLHMNTDRLWTSLSRDPMKFPAMQELIRNANDADRHIVAIGFVVAGEQETPNRRVLGFLYGAGAVPSLDQNRIFAVWLQKKLVLDGVPEFRALGPDRQVLTTDKPLRGRLSVLMEDGSTPLASGDVDLRPGRAYQLQFDKGSK